MTYRVHVRRPPRRLNSGVLTITWATSKRRRDDPDNGVEGASVAELMEHRDPVGQACGLALCRRGLRMRRRGDPCLHGAVVLEPDSTIQVPVEPLAVPVPITRPRWQRLTEISGWADPRRGHRSSNVVTHDVERPCAPAFGQVIPIENDLDMSFESSGVDQW